MCYSSFRIMWFQITNMKLEHVNAYYTVWKWFTKKNIQKVTNITHIFFILRFSTSTMIRPFHHIWILKMILNFNNSEKDTELVLY